MSNFGTGVDCSGHLQIVLQQAYQYKLKSTKNIKSSLTLVFECKGSKWRKRLRNCIKHVKRKKDCFQASHRAVAEIQGEANIYDPCREHFCLGGNNCGQICFPNCCLLILMPIWLDGGGVVLLLLMEGCRVMKQTKVKVAISWCKTVCLWNIAAIVIEKEIWELFGGWKYQMFEFEVHL